MLPFDDILENLQQGIILLDTNLRILFFNTPASEILEGQEGAIYKGMAADTQRPLRKKTMIWSDGGHSCCRRGGGRPSSRFLTAGLLLCPYSNQKTGGF